MPLVASVVSKVLFECSVSVFVRPSYCEPALLMLTLSIQSGKLTGVEANQPSLSWTEMMAF